MSVSEVKFLLDLQPLISKTTRYISVFDVVPSRRYGKFISNRHWKQSSEQRENFRKITLKNNQKINVSHSNITEFNENMLV